MQEQAIKSQEQTNTTNNKLTATLSITCVTSIIYTRNLILYLIMLLY